MLCRHIMKKRSISSRTDRIGTGIFYRQDVFRFYPGPKTVPVNNFLFLTAVRKILPAAFNGG
jgi:hypothetical protein